MGEPSPKRRRSDPVVRGPVVILPPATPGGRERRFVIQPIRVFGLLGLCFTLGVATCYAILWFVADPVGTKAELERQSQELAQVQDELARLRAGAPPADEPAPAGDVEALPAEPTGPRLELSIASLSGDEPTVRVAVVSPRGEVILHGEGLVLAHKEGEPTPMPRGKARIKPSPGGGIWIEGVGGVRRGTPVETRIGPISIGDRSYPGHLELYEEGGELTLVAEVAMEEYVAGVVSSEVPASWGLEAKKAQAVAARSYAVMRRAQASDSWHLRATVLDQVYSGRPVDPGSRAAVEATHGQVLALDGDLVSVYFSSTCAGHTETPDNVWPDRPSHGTASVACGFCDRSPNYSWTTSIGAADLQGELRGAGHKAGAIERLELRSGASGGRVRAIDVVTDDGTVTLAGNEFRALIGYGKVKSTRFSVEFDPAASAFVLSGSGFGHGVGLCQWGAQGMDRAGRDYREILGRYFPQTDIAHLW